jgi:aryl-phospho-beta-D-glucosidase BglC (GH1 family)
MALENIKIKGVNLGSWLLMEGYILGGRNIPEASFKRDFSRLYGAGQLREFESSFRDNFIREEDFRNIAAMGACAIRVPFNHRLIETRPFVYSDDGLAYLERACRWAAKYNLKLIFDLHAAPGSQNPDWHSDCPGKVLFWKDKSCRERTSALLERIADRFKDEPAVLGYDIINEPVLGWAPEIVLKKFYQDAVKRVKAIDKKHIIFLEGHDWGRKIGFLRGLIQDRVWISIHFYEPFQYAFNLAPHYRFPGKVEGALWVDARIRRHLEYYYKFSQRYKVNFFVGEFGVNWRGGFFGEPEWLESTLAAFEDFGFGYTYWTYKAVAGKVYPDGLYQYLPNSRYVRREGPVYGWENYLKFWKREKLLIKNFWRSKNFTANNKLIDMLNGYFKK